MNMDNGEKKPNFAETLQRYRTRLGLSMRKFAEKIGVSPAYISRLEYGTYPAPENEVLDNIIKGLNLTPQEEREVYDIAATERNESASRVIAQDTRDYIADNPIIVTALRTAKDGGFGLAEWQRFIEECEKKNQS
jgi:transcriptional regulator with XRE-family HTH domain